MSYVLYVICFYFLYFRLKAPGQGRVEKMLQTHTVKKTSLSTVVRCFVRPCLRGWSSL